MAEANKSQSELLALFPDNNNGLIGAKDLRDLVTSVGVDTLLHSDTSTTDNLPEGSTNRYATAATLNQWASDKPIGPVINVGTYGAVGNGVADDTAAIQAALDAAASLNVPEVILLPGKTYKISSTINLKANVTLRGAYGMRAHNATTAPVITTTQTINMLTAASGLRNVGVCGLRINGGAQATAGVFLDTTILSNISDCYFLSMGTGGAGIKAGGCLYVTIERCGFNTNAGWYALDALDSYSSLSASTYYGINVGVMRDCIVNANRGVRVEGTFDVENCDFEGAMDTGANAWVDFVAPSANSFANITNNYFEISGTNSNIRAIRCGGVAGTISGNRIFGPGKTIAGAAAIDLKNGYSYSVVVTGNHIGKWETGVIVSDSYVSNQSVFSNNFTLVTTPVSGTASSRNITVPPKNYATDSPSTPKRFTENNFNGWLFDGGGISSSIVTVYDGVGVVLDASVGNHFRLNYTTATTVTGFSNKIPGQWLTIGSNNGNATLQAAGFGLAANRTLRTNEYLTFFIDPNGNIRPLQSPEFVLQSPNGTRYRLAVADNGTLSATAL